MKRMLWGLVAALGLATGPMAVAEEAVRINPTDPQPTCTMCPGTYIPASELERYTQKAIAEKLIDQQVRDIDIGKARIGIGMVHRGRLEILGKQLPAMHACRTRKGKRGRRQ